MDESKIRQALAFTATFRKIGYRYIHSSVAVRKTKEDVLYMSVLQLSAALAQLRGDPSEEDLPEVR